MSADGERRRWPELTREERRDHYWPQLNNPRIDRFWKKVMFESIDHGIGWASALERVRARERDGGRS